jgi:hypothetical protein
MNPFEAEDKYKELSEVFARGDITRATKAELERFAVLLSRPGASIAFGGSQFPQACETVRLMLTVRMSEEQNLQARKESRLALIIAWAALFAGIVQAVVSAFQFLSSSPVVVQANIPLPVRAAETVPVSVVQGSPAQAIPPVPSAARPSERGAKK